MWIILNQITFKKIVGDKKNNGIVGKMCFVSNCSQPHHDVF
ncbi:hypothetical protein L798_15242 [Zootermopsis nevadensis]|uniref:Uncharacterized protein n=1 Tax=Zootermopsis nevadensis TaxID=136037 RepID=A0A067QNG9_ZOONE|nr:hypothetical protein L798_15242 [Zootermopsis nevadensis]